MLFDGVIGIFIWVWDNGIVLVLDKLGLLDFVLNVWNVLQEGFGVVLDWISVKFNMVMIVIKLVLDGLKWVNDNGVVVINFVIGGNKGFISSGLYIGGVMGLIVFGVVIFGVIVFDGVWVLGGLVCVGLIYCWQEEGCELFMLCIDGNVIFNCQLCVMQVMVVLFGGLCIQFVVLVGLGVCIVFVCSLCMDIGGIIIYVVFGMILVDVVCVVCCELEMLVCLVCFDLYDGGDYV